MADTTVSAAQGDIDDHHGMWGPYWLNATDGAIIFIDAGSDLTAAYTDDGGASWTMDELDTANSAPIACWYERETPNDTGRRVHVVRVNHTTNDVECVFWSISTQTWSTPIAAYSGTSLGFGAANFNRVTITRTRNGNLLVAFNLADNGVDVEGLRRSVDDGDNWTSRTAAIYELTGAATTSDQAIAFPANTADEADAAFVYWDFSANAISIKMYDDSADTMTETAVQSVTKSGTPQPQWGGALRLSDGLIILGFHNNFDVAASNDLEVWELTPDSIAAPTTNQLTDVFTNTRAAICTVLVDQQNNDLYVAYYLGVFGGTGDVVYQLSQDDGATWDGQTAYSESTLDWRRISSGRTITATGGRWQPALFDDDSDTVFVNLVNDIGVASTIPIPVLQHHLQRN